MREIIAARDPVRTEIWSRGRRDRPLRSRRRALQGRADRGDPRGPGDPHVLARRLAGSLPRPRTSSTRASSRPTPSSSPASRAPTGAATRGAANSNASTAWPSVPATTSRPTCGCSRRPSGATTAAWAARWTSSTCRRRPRARSSGTPTAGPCTSACRTTCAAASAPAATSRSTPPRSSRAASGSARATGTSTATTCSSWKLDEEHAREKAVNALKPMNCPCHVQVFNQGLKSYRDLPAADGGIRLLHPLRAFGRAARHHARARLHPGRRAHLLHGGADRARNAPGSSASSRGSTRTSASRPSTSSSPPGPSGASAPTSPGTTSRAR